MILRHASDMLLTYLHIQYYETKNNRNDAPRNVGTYRRPASDALACWHPQSAAPSSCLFIHRHRPTVPRPPAAKITMYKIRAQPSRFMGFFVACVQRNCLRTSQAGACPGSAWVVVRRDGGDFLQKVWRSLRRVNHVRSRCAHSSRTRSAGSGTGAQWGSTCAVVWRGEGEASAEASRRNVSP